MTEHDTGPTATRDSGWRTLPATRVRVGADVDVLVAGGGPAGVSAAVAAARTGARTVLVEKSGMLGGTATGSLVASFMGYYWRDEPVAGGIPREITDRLVAAGGAQGFTPYLLAEAAASPLRVRTFPFDPEVLKIVLDELVAEAGVQVRLHTQVLDPLPAAEDPRRTVGLAVRGLDETEALLAPVVVDATADAVVARTAGAAVLDPSRTADDLQPMTMMARLSGVDVARFRALPRETKRELAVAGVRAGSLRQELLSVVAAPADGDAFILMTRVAGLDPADTADRSRAEVEGRRQVADVVAYLRRAVPGFERSHLAATAGWIGVRETWRVVGDHVLTEQEVLGGAQFADGIAEGGGPLDVHDQQHGLRLVEPPQPFGVPYRCLLPAGLDGLLVAGRCVSASRTAMGAIRHMGTAMALGQAAGTAAALAAGATGSACAPRDVSVPALRARLHRAGAVLTDPRVVPVDRDRATAAG